MTKDLIRLRNFAYPTLSLNMLPYQAMAMDYAVTSSFQRHPGNAVNMNMNMNMNPAFTHSWFMPADLCVPFKPSQPLLEPGHVFIILIINFIRAHSLL